MFVTKGALEREKDHVEGFAPEVRPAAIAIDSCIPHQVTCAFIRTAVRYLVPHQVVSSTILCPCPLRAVGVRAGGVGDQVG
jgi:hypothetical protein